ncbi:MAG: FAD-binding protein [Desulfosarcinaceae bacterium]|nr:FAD-binding protein [Desulfosarcinaceae bacterium]
MTPTVSALKDPAYVSGDVIVIGGGGAGLRSAIAAATTGHRDVIVVSKSKAARACNTYLSKGIVAASGQSTAPDSAQRHMVDTLEGGRYLNDPAVVSRMTQRIPSEISFLADCGVPFSREGEKLHVFHTPGHTHPRHVFSANWKGSDLVLPLRRRANQMGIQFCEHVFITRLFTAEGRICGAAGVMADGRFMVFEASSIILATGGYAQIYLNTNNAPGITGDGQALAYHLGVPLKDMEFVQFYPTALGRRGSRLFLNEKLLAQAGVRLENANGEDLFERYGHPDRLKVTRDQLAQMVCREGQGSATAHRYAVMNLDGLSSEAAARLGQLVPSSFWQGQKRFQVVPTTHYCMGGIVTDDGCRTAVKGLFAVGEAAAGCHGANRLGGNSLAEIFSMGSIAGEFAAKEAGTAKHSDLLRDRAADEKQRLENFFSNQGEPPRRRMHALKNLMWDKVGIIREKTALETALGALQDDGPQASVASYADLIKRLEYGNMRLVAEMVCRAALYREESRGSHFRQDFANEDDDNWRKNIVVRNTSSGMELDIMAVPQETG